MSATEWVEGILTSRWTLVGHSVDGEGHSAEFADDAAEVGVELGFHFLFDRRRPIVRTEDEMDEYVGGSMAHFLTPLRGW